MKRYSLFMFVLTLIVFVMFILPLSSCSLFRTVQSDELTALEKAKAVGEELTKEFNHYSEDINLLYETGDDEIKAFLDERVIPYVKRANSYLAGYMGIVRAWEESEEDLDDLPSGISDMEKNFRRVLQLAVTAFLEIQKE